MEGFYQINSRGNNLFFRFNLTLQLIILNVFFYIVSLIILGVYGETFFSTNLALNPAYILNGEKIWTIFTSIFVHGSFFHLFANMFSLFFIGNFLEKLIGRKRFLWVYLISGLVGGLFFIFFSVLFGNPDVFAVGASGAIFGLLGVLALLVPHSKIYLIVGPLLLIVAEVVLTDFLPGSILPLFSFIVNILFIAMIFSLLFPVSPILRKLSLPLQLSMWMLPFVAIIPLSIISLFVPLPIGNSAHFGGLVVGLIYGFYLRKKFPNKTKRISKLFS